MIYETASGKKIDTTRDLNFEERNFIQKMIIYQHLKMPIDEFRAKWRQSGNPVWKGPATLDNPTPALFILLDLENKLQSG